MEFSHVVDDLINPAYIMKPQEALCTLKLSGASWIDKYIDVPGGWPVLIPWEEGVDALCLGTSQTLAFASLHLSSPDLCPL